jgi:hypothetical protein
MMQCDILVRGEATHSLQGTRLFAYAKRTARFDGEVAAWLCRLFGVMHQASAPFSAMGEGLDATQGYWLHADPVHLALMRDFFILHGTPHDLNPHHVQQMIATLNQHFSGDGMQWFSPHPERWYLRLEQPLPITSVSKTQAIGNKLSNKIGKDLNAAQYATMLNEIQMLLHQHAANIEREEAGLLPLNSVWLWGGGSYVIPALQPYTAVMADEPLVKGLAGAHCQPVPDSAECLPQQGHCLVVLEEVDEPQFEQNWAAPLLRMLKNNKVQKLVLHLEQEQGVVSLVLQRQDLWKFWRRWLS